MRKNHATTEARADAARPCALALERESFVLAAIGLALCISAPEASRYSALWHVSDESSLLGSGLRVAYLLTLFFIVRFAAARGHAPLQRNRPLLSALASLQTIGFALLIASSAGWDLPPLAALARSALLDSSLFLFAAFASFYARANAETAISSFVVSVIVAGTVQICLAFLPFPAAAGLVVLFAPLSVLLLRLADRRTEGPGPRHAPLPDSEQTVFENAEAQDQPPANPVANDANAALARENAPIGGLYAAIALLSFIVAAIHLSWLGVQDGDAASTMVQVCAGVGTVLAGNILLAVRRRLEDREVVEFTRLIVLPVAIGTLYAGSLLSGSLVALSVIPLNIVYVAVLLLAWLAPFAYAEGRNPVVVSCDAFLAKRLGVLVGIGLLRDLATGDFAWVNGALTIVAIAGLISLSVAWFLNAKRRADRAAAQPSAQAGADAEEARDLACARVAERFRLTPREREVLGLLVRGRTAGYIAEALVISSTTAKTHIRHIYQKAGVQSKQVLLDIVEAELQPLVEHCAQEHDGLQWAKPTDRKDVH